MGEAARSPCPGDDRCGQTVLPSSDYTYTLEDDVHGEGELGLKNLKDLNDNTAGDLSPLVFQSGGVPSTPKCGTGTPCPSTPLAILGTLPDFPMAGLRWVTS